MAAARRLIGPIDHHLPLVQQVASQAPRRILNGQKVLAKEELVSIFEPHARIIPHHKGGADLEFGQLLVADDVEGRDFTRFAVCDDKIAEQGHWRRPWSIISSFFIDHRG